MTVVVLAHVYDICITVFLSAGGSVQRGRPQGRPGTPLLALCFYTYAYKRILGII